MIPNTPWIALMWFCLVRPWPKRFVGGCWSGKKHTKNKNLCILLFFGVVIWLLASACRPTLSAIRAAGSMEITSTACPTSRTLWAAPWPAKVPWFPIAKWDVFPWTLRAGTNPEKVLIFCRESILNLPDNSGLPLRSILSSVSFGGGRWAESC